VISLIDVQEHNLVDLDKLSPVVDMVTFEFSSLHTYLI